MNNEIIVTKANVHNLKNVSIKIPKNTLTVITGPSGSGKSSLAFDTIYVEGQRRYIESLSSYARQFLGQHQPPDVESIDGLSPSISIDQKTSSRNPRSTVGTTTEIYDYLRVLFARVGTLYCPETGEEVTSYTPAKIVKEISKLKEKTKLHICAPIAEKESVDNSSIQKFLSQGFTRAIINGELLSLDEGVKFLKNKKYDVDLVVDRLLVKSGIQKRLTDSVEHALKLGNGIIKVYEGEIDKKSKYKIYSEINRSPSTGEVFPDLEPRLFSFNSPLGACPSCNGIGIAKSFDKSLMILDSSFSLMDGAIPLLSKKNNFLHKMVLSIAEAEKVDLTKPYNKLPKKFLNILWDGSDKIYKYQFKSENSHFEFSKAFPGITEWLNKKYRETSSERTRKELEKSMNILKCSTCDGMRLNKTALSVKINDSHIIDICSLSIKDTHAFTSKIKLTGEKKEIASKLLKEINNRLSFLLNVGLDYLTLDRAANTLSGGESQRIRLATQIGSALSGVLYVLDEPSIGLHQRDNEKLIETLKNLRDLGNTVLVVEHDEDTMMASDYIIDMGPKAGIFGGEVISKGTPTQILKDKKSLTAKYLSGKKEIEIPKERLKVKDFLTLKGASQNNIKDLDVDIPKEGLTCITGVSGSGKSTLVHSILVPAIKAYLSKANRALYENYNYQSISNLEDLKSIIELDQSPIGRTPHSNPATYTGLFDEIRTLYSKTQESQIRGYKPGRFSFNVKGGRCEHCEGNGVKKIEMHFLPDVYITCDECKGSRYNDDTLSILYKGQHISDILKMSISEARDFFTNHKKIFRILDTLYQVGLGYLKLGQPATTLSGGEAQRLKLSRELAKSPRGKCIYVLDEPTTGLHFEDIAILLNALKLLIEKGHSIVIIEHNLDVIKTADHIIDLGPDGGDKGGKIVAIGSPEQIIKNKKSLTAKYLKKVMNK